MSRKSRAAARAAAAQQQARSARGTGLSSTSTGPSVIGDPTSQARFNKGDPGALISTSPYSGQARAGQNQLAQAGTTGMLEQAQQPWWAQQLANYGQLQQQGFQGLQNMGQQPLPQLKPFDFAPIKQNAISAFQNEVMPSIAERFAGMGTGDNLSSSAYLSSLRTGSEDFMKQLAALQSQMQEQHNLSDVGYQLQGRGMNQNLYGTMGELGGQGGYNTQNLRNNMYGQMMNQGYAPQWDYTMRQAQPSGRSQLFGTIMGRAAEMGGKLGSAALMA